MVDDAVWGRGVDIEIENIEKIRVVVLKENDEGSVEREDEQRSTETGE